MSRILAIDWDHEQLCVVEAVGKGGRMVARRAFRWSEKLGPNPAHAEEAGRRLRERLKEARLAPAPVLFSLGRDRVIVREVRYPDVPAAEVPAIVRMQASKDLPFPADEAVIDYTVSTIGGPKGEKRALAVVLRKELLQSIRKTMATAGLKLEGLSLRPFGMVANGQAAPNLNGEAVALLALNNGSTEFCIAREGELLFSRVVGLAPGSIADADMRAYLPELRRSIAAYAGQFPQYPVKSMLLSGAPPNNGKGEIAAELGIPVVEVDPLTAIEYKNIPETDRGVFAGMVGLLQSASRLDRLPVNFLQPKRPQPPKSGAAWVALAAILFVLIIAGGGGVWYWNVLSEREERISELQAEKDRIDKQIAAYGDMETRLKAIEEQTGGELVVLDELYDWIARFPDVASVRVVEFNYTATEKKEVRTGPGGKPAPQKPATGGKNVAEPIGTLKLELAGTNDGLNQIRRLIETDNYMKLDDKDWRSSPDLKDRDKSAVSATVQIYAKTREDYYELLKPGTHHTADGSAAPPRRPGGRPR